MTAEGAPVDAAVLTRRPRPSFPRNKLSLESLRK
jgi:hypothetical protein